MAIITVRKNGGVWVASDGKRHVEADNPDDAFFLLRQGHIEQEHVAGGSVYSAVSRARAEDLEDEIGKSVIMIIRLLALRAAPDLIRKHFKLLSDRVERRLENYDD